MTEQTEMPRATPEPWYVQHAKQTRHTTRIALDDPGSCEDCDERSPAYRLTEPLRGRS